MTTCEPPPRHRDRQWHWLRHEDGIQWFVFEAREGQLWNGPSNMSADHAYARGWRYFGPVDLPSIAPKPKTGIPAADMSDEEWEAFIRRRGPQGSQPRPA